MPDAKSWRKRRWDIFKKAYNSSQPFREALAEYKNQGLEDLSFNSHAHLLSDNGVPVYNVLAVVTFIKNPDMKEKEYLKQITVPISMWNKDSKTLKPMGDEGSFYKQVFIMLYLVRKKYNIPEDLWQEFDVDIVKAMAMDNTIIQVHPYVSKSELREMIMEFGEDFADLSNKRNSLKDDMYSPRLFGKVFSPADQATSERDDMIRKWRKQNIKYKEIISRLEALGIDAPDEQTMKQMVYNWKQKSKKHI